MAGITHFGKVLAFYTRARPDGDNNEFIAYRPVVELHMQYRWWQEKWGTAVKVVHVSSIIAVVGIRVGPSLQDIHILRKHPGLSLLSKAESGLTSSEENYLDRSSDMDVDIWYLGLNASCEWSASFSLRFDCGMTLNLEAITQPKNCARPKNCPKRLIKSGIGGPMVIICRYSWESPCDDWWWMEDRI